MASTDAKSGFRLPWSSDRNESDDPTATSAAESTSVDAVGPQTESESETPTMTDTATTASGETLQDAAPAPEAVEAVAQPEPAAPEAAEVTPAPAPARKANKFMADLTKAMQAAAESARADSLERFSSDAKAHIESIHASTADESVSLRKRADDDISAIREWSKAEIARIREETDERVSHRKDVLEREIEAHAAEIEQRIERVQGRVASFEAEMAAFFERLLGEDDPTRFASMAEHLPEPPPFDADAAWDARPVVESPVAEAVASVEPAPAEVDVDVDQSADAPVAEASVADAPAEDGTVADADAGAGEEDLQATASETAEPAAGEASSTDSGDLFGIDSDPAPIAESDPRLAALGVEQAEAAEAEAAAIPTDGNDGEDEIPTIPEDALAARLAGLVEDHPAAPADGMTTRVIVTGLVSVASIAGFKRNLARVNGVRSVGVSSGPDGEFVFAVHHETDLALGEGITMLPGFGARVTNEAPGELTVAARDPESDG